MLKKHFITTAVNESLRVGKADPPPFNKGGLIFYSNASLASPSGEGEVCFDAEKRQKRNGGNANTT